MINVKNKIKLAYQYKHIKHIAVPFKSITYETWSPWRVANTKEVPTTINTKQQ